MAPQIQRSNRRGVLSSNHQNIVVEIGMRLTIVVKHLWQVFSRNMQQVRAIVISRRDDYLAAGVVVDRVDQATLVNADHFEAGPLRLNRARQPGRPRANHNDVGAHSGPRLQVGLGQRVWDVFYRQEWLPETSKCRWELLILACDDSRLRASGFRL